MNTWDPYAGKRPVGDTVSPEASSPRRALREVEDMAADKVAAWLLAEEAAGKMWAGVKRPATPAVDESRTINIPEGGERKRNWLGIVARTVGAIAAVGTVMAMFSYLHESKEERAQEWIKRGENPALYCKGLGGTLHTIQASGVTAEGVRFVADVDTPWGLYGQQGSFRRDVNELGLGSNDRKVQVCEVKGSERQQLSVVPDPLDTQLLKSYVARHDNPIVKLLT